jgi:thiopeptide-type bacteriocin biosynthesis protein
LLGLSRSLESPSLVHDPAALESAITRDCDTSIADLRAIVQADPAVREAFFVASSSLDAALDAWLADPASSRAKGVTTIVLRYVSRMAARSTPFGLFSGCCVGSLGGATRLVLGPRSEYRCHSRLDMHYLDALCEALLDDDAIRHALDVRVNTGAHVTAMHYRFAESHTDPTMRSREYRLVSIARTPHVDATVARAAQGASISELARALTSDDPTIPNENALEFVDELVRSQLLVSELAPAVTGTEPLDRLIETLRTAAPGRQVAQVLADVSGRLRVLDAAGIGRADKGYRELASALGALPVEPNPARLFHVDLYKPVVGAKLGPEVLREIDRAISVLQRVSQPSESGDLREFRRAFVERYEQREVPLPDALDDESGIGFHSNADGSSEPSPLLEGLPFKSTPPPLRVAVGRRVRHLARSIDAAVRKRSIEWELTADDISALSADTPAPLPDAFAFCGTIVASSRAGAELGELRVHVRTVAGPSGATLLGRFCHGHPQIREHVRAHLRAEESMRPDAIFAEVVHLPEGRLGNILARPCLRPFEIPYLCRAGADEQHRIGIDDLLVSVRGERVVLRSKRLGREVIPRMTTAHNFSNAVLGIYRFLCALQTQDGSWLGFSWAPFDGAPFLPRVRVGGAILSPATWTLSKTDLAQIVKGTAAMRYVAMRRLRDCLDLPRWVGVVDGDNVLPIDLEHPLHLDSLRELASTRDSLRLSELAVLPEQACVQGPEGRFAHEIVVPFIRDAAPGSSVIRPSKSIPAPRSFPPGSEWLYAKIYTGTVAADAVLREAIAPILRECAISSWFFIRYTDPSSHLRVRVHGEPLRLIDEVFGALRGALTPKIVDGTVWRLQLDTYEREVERYGGPVGIELSEQIFAADSDAVLSIIGHLVHDDGNQHRCDLAVFGVHRLLCDFGFDAPQKFAVARHMRDAFLREHEVDADFKRQLGSNFRQGRARYESIVRGEVHPEGRAAFASRALRVTKVAEELRTARAAGTLSVSISAIAQNCAHLHVNRMLRSEQRAQELVIYDILARLYDAQLARRMTLDADCVKGQAT